MEQEIGTFKISFKENLNMLDWQKILQIQKAFLKDQDEMQATFDLFVALCDKIDWETKSDQEKKVFIQWLTDISIFAELTEMMTKITKDTTEAIEKKKKTGNTSSPNGTK